MLKNGGAAAFAIQLPWQVQRQGLALHVAQTHGMAAAIGIPNASFNACNFWASIGQKLICPGPVLGGDALHSRVASIFGPP
jgi:hypothetical protein